MHKGARNLGPCFASVITWLNAKLAVEDLDDQSNAKFVYDLWDRVVAGWKPRTDANGVWKKNRNLNQYAIQSAHLSTRERGILALVCTKENGGGLDGPSFSTKKQL